MSTTVTTIKSVAGPAADLKLAKPSKSIEHQTAAWRHSLAVRGGRRVGVRVGNRGEPAQGSHRDTGKALTAAVPRGETRFCPLCI